MVAPTRQGRTRVEQVEHLVLDPSDQLEVARGDADLGSKAKQVEDDSGVRLQLLGVGRRQALEQRLRKLWHHPCVASALHTEQ